MFSRKINAAVLVAIALCAAIPVRIDSQARRRTTTTRRRLRRAANRPPAVPAVNYSAPRNAGDLASTLGGLTGRVKSGNWGVMVVSLTRGDTLYAENAGEQMLPASTMKLLTSAVAFERFGPNYQLSTDALRDGPVGPTEF
jgi:D-alanyl-D-alanine carboxypeptidase/D-alanyl-D-alanine-endopeptidase (penicillin-binding protein 4)